MKKTQKRKRLTFGEYIAGVYEAVGGRKAKRVIRLAVNTRQVGFLGSLHYVVA
ncbi:MAG: hypothetical protein HS113_02950 [Verrucomicrobiales bacterium]|nr:hypothetical protein [Verrucomicrobiales bacterium]